MAYRRDSFEGLVLEGDPQALGTVIRWIATVLASPRFWRLRQEWLDLHQEILARVIESLRRERFDPEKDLRTYVQGMARYTALETLRHVVARGSSSNPGCFVVANPSENPQSVAIARQLTRFVLDAASPACRDLIRAYFIEQKGYEEIARAMGVPVGTVKSRLARCLGSAHRAVAGRQLEWMREG